MLESLIDLAPWGAHAVVGVLRMSLAFADLSVLGGMKVWECRVSRV